MQDIIAAATELGKKIAASERTQAFLTAAKAVAADKDAQSVLREFQTQSDKLRELAESGKAIEPNDKRKLAEMESAVASNDKLKAMMRAQTDYFELMTRVQQAIDAATQL